MQEDFLHYVWKYQKFTVTTLHTIAGETVQVRDPGTHNFNAGPDFLNAQLLINDQLWAGNVELHVKSSDWYAHKHQDNPAYDSVLLHLVWEYNVAVFRANDTVIPTIEMKAIILPAALRGYKALLEKQPKFIACEHDFAKTDSFTHTNWLERLYLERLEQKTESIFEQLGTTINHWEALFFQQLCKNFGLKVNSESFLSIAQSVPFSVIQKCTDTAQTLEALLFGQAGLLDVDIEDAYLHTLQVEYAYLKKKFKLSNTTVIVPNYFRLRPPNFPTIRLAQLAALYTSKSHLFSVLISVGSVEEIYTLFNVKASDYWDLHYNFGVISSAKEKRLTKKFIDLVVLNTVLPFQFCYAKYQGRDYSEELLEMATAISAEKNTIITKFNTINFKVENAMQSQSLLQLYTHYCTAKRCLHCAVGNKILTYK